MTWEVSFLDVYNELSFSVVQMFCKAPDEGQAMAKR